MYTPIAHWSFDTDADCKEITGPHTFVDGVQGQALKSNEFGTEIHREEGICTCPTFSVETWIAPHTYPWNHCPILTQKTEHLTFYFSINYQGQLQFHVLVEDTWFQCESLPALPGLNEKMKFAGEGGTPETTADFGDARPCPTIPTSSK